jgi:hypothetical protein
MEHMRCNKCAAQMAAQSVCIAASCNHLFCESSVVYCTSKHACLLCKLANARPECAAGRQLGARLMAVFH